jgi:uncharacterized membrane protein (TIGR02234 family)
VSGSRLDGPGAAAVLALAGGALGLLSASRPWVHAVVQDPVLGRTTVTASGRQAAAVVPAVALVALAGGVALLLARTLGRRVAGIVLVLAGAAEVAATIGAIRSPKAGVSDLVARAVGAVGTTDVSVQVTGWPWLAVAGGVLVVLAGALAVLRARHWDVRSSRYEPPAEASTGPEDGGAPEDGAPDTWDALSRGEDPTR